MKAILEDGDGRKIELYGRVRAIILELAEMRDDINETSPGRLEVEIQIHCLQEDIKISTKKWREK